MSHTINVQEDAPLGGFAGKSYGTNTPPAPHHADDAASAETQRLDSATFLLHNLCCDLENKLIDRALKGVPGVADYRSNIIAKTLTVDFFPNLIDHRTLLQKLNEMKLGAVARGRNESATEDKQSSFRIFMNTLSQTAGSNLVAGMTALMVLAYFSPTHAKSAYQKKEYFLWAVLVLGVLNLTQKVLDGISAAGTFFTLDIKTLVLLASVAAVFSGQVEEGAAMVYLFALSKLFEHATMNTVTALIHSALGGGMDQVGESMVILSETRAEIKISDIKIGDKLLICSGESIPVDGIVTQHEGTVDESSVTGESVPQYKKRGSTVLANTLLTENALEVEATATPATSSSSKLLSMIENTISTKTKKTQKIDVIASVYTKVILALSLGFLVWGFAASDPSTLHKALLLIVLGCPCALIMAAPIVTSCSIVGLAKKRVFIKDCEHLDILSAVTKLSWDKTGTLTEGRYGIIESHVVGGVEARGMEVKSIISLQSLSMHPVTHVITQDFHGCLTEAVDEHGVGLALPKIENFKFRPGKGLTGTATINGKSVSIATGSQNFMQESGARMGQDILSFVERNQGWTIVMGAADGQVVKAWCLGDSVRSESAPAVRALRGLGVQSAILSGDKNASVQKAAQEIGIRNAWGGLLPEGKVEKVKEWQSHGDVVAMIGDGQNDAPALAAADTGLALCPAGTTAFITTSTAPIVLASSDVSLLPEAIGFTRWASSVLYQNIFLSLAPKMLFLLLTLSGIMVAPLWVAVFIDFSCLMAVLLNGTRLLCC